MAFCVKAITNISKLRETKDSWNAFINRYSDNPFFLYEFLTEYIDMNREQSWDPLIFVGHDDDEIVGIAPLMTKKVLGVRLVTTILKPYDTPDFIVIEKFRKEFIECIIDHLFQTIGCNVIDLVLSPQTKNLDILVKMCRVKRIRFGTEPYIGHRMLKVNGDWKLFEKHMTGTSRKHFRQAERKLNDMGSCKIMCFEKKERKSVGDHKLVEIDKRSWKETWRARRGKKIDPELLILLNGSGQVASSVPDFKCKTWVLELNNRPIAFVVIIQYKKTAYIAKTSYVAHASYERYSPGLLIMNAAIRDLFEGKSVVDIDFLTDMPFMKRWPTSCQRRTRILLTKGMLERLVASLYLNRNIRRIVKGILLRARAKKPSLSLES